MPQVIDQPEVIKTFFVTHIGTVKVNNYGAVEFEAKMNKVILHIDTLYEITRETRRVVAEMRKDGVYAR